MFGTTYEEIIERIMSEKGLSKEDVNFRVNDKLTKLSGLISNTGAAHIVANELGVKIFENTKKDFKIKNLFSGVRGVTLNSKVIAKYDVREFNKNGRIGKVQNLLIGDDSGTCRLVIWDSNQINTIETVNPNDILRVDNFYIKENNFGKEIHLTNDSKIEINPAGVVIADVNKEIDRGSVVKIKDLGENQNTTIQGTIVQVFDLRFYDSCPECNKKVIFEDGAFKCNEHGIVKEVPVPILNFYLDDGSEAIRTVLFRDNAKKILKLDDETILEIRKNPDLFNSVKDNILGELIKVSGRTNKNEMFQRVEFTGNYVEKVDVKKVLSEVVNSL
ncbi:MAG: hypothetical protein PHE43_00905 [Candidatus Nanoarchaeia archaeon]|nr:hypothetical protein [Candidatus Nanoarchaeia archaeon]